MLEIGRLEHNNI